MTSSTARPTVVPLRRRPVPTTQGTLALDLDVEPLRAAPSSSGMAPVVAIRPTDLDAWATRYVQAAVEIVGGDRPASQLVRHSGREVFADLERRALLVARAGGHAPGQRRVQPVRPRVLSVHTCRVDDDTVEAAVRVRYGERSRAVAVRFERRRDRWVCTALEFV